MNNNEDIQDDLVLALNDLINETNLDEFEELKEPIVNIKIETYKKKKIINPKIIVLFGNQVSSIVKNEKNISF